jgi:hypothetical protein
MDARTIEDWVDAAARLHGLALDDAQRARVAAVFVRNAALGRLVLDMELPPDCEPAPVFEP